MKFPNPGEAITLRNRITAAEKAFHLAEKAADEATNVVVLLTTEAEKANEVVKKTKPEDKTWNDVVKAANEAEAKLSAAREAEGKAWDARTRAAFNVNDAKARAAAMCA